MNLSSHEPLLAAASRQVCSQCKRRRKFYCYNCHIPLTSVPRVALPLRADIVHHPAESLAKRTSVHGALLAPEFVRIVEFDPAALAPYPPASTVLLFPSAQSVRLQDLPRAELDAIERVVLVDSQWQRANAVLRHPALRALRPIHLSSGAQTAFWRYQSFGRDHLATIEALYYFEREYLEAKTGKPYAGEFDDLLWYFSFNYRLIQQYYRTHTQLRFFHIENYIHYDDKADGDCKDSDSSTAATVTAPLQQQQQPVLSR